MGNCQCCMPKKPAGAGKCIGRLQYHGSGCCGRGHPYTFKGDECCLPKSPTDPKWVAAAPGFEKLLADVDTFAVENKTCCNSADPFKTKVKLDVDWTPRANAYLAQHGLVCQTHAYVQYVSHGQGGHVQPMMELVIYELDGKGVSEEMEKLAKESAEAITKNDLTAAPAAQIIVSPLAQP